MRYLLTSILTIFILSSDVFAQTETETDENARENDDQKKSDEVLKKVPLPELVEIINSKQMAGDRVAAIACSTGGISFEQSIGDSKTFVCEYIDGLISYDLELSGHNDVKTIEDEKNKTYLPYKISRIRYYTNSGCSEKPSVNLKALKLRGLGDSNEYISIPSTFSEPQLKITQECEQLGEHPSQLEIKYRSFFSGEKQFFEIRREFPSQQANIDHDIKYKTKTHAWISADSMSSKGIIFPTSCDIDFGASAFIKAKVLNNKSAGANLHQVINNAQYICYVNKEARLENSEILTTYLSLSSEMRDAPPSSQKLFKQKLDLEFNKLKKELSSLISCPHGATLHSSASDQLDSISWTCKRNESYKSICPNISMDPGLKLSSFLPSFEEKGKYAILDVETSCSYQNCPQGWELRNNQCYKCPEGTSFDDEETKKMIKDGKYDKAIRLCRGKLPDVENLIPKFENSGFENEQAEE